MRKPAPRLTVSVLCTGLALSACALSACAAVPTSAPRPVAVGTRPAATRAAIPLAAAMKVSLGSGASLGGRRVFRMAPIHHHFELLGWPETTVIVRFWMIAGMFSAVALGLYYADFASLQSLL